MTARRGFLGGLAALGMGAPLARDRGVQELAQAQRVEAMSRAVSGAQIGALGGPPRREDPLWALFEQRMSGEWRRRDRLQRRLAMTGGVPAGVLACRSWKPWFAAAVADRWIDEQMPHPSVVERAIYRAVFGKEMDDGRGG